MNSCRITFLFLLLLFINSCKKNSETKTDTPPENESTGPVQYETPFANIPATADIAMYEINERAFSVSGDFAGIIARLDSIKDLGINVIWLMPVHPIGAINSVNSPYSVKNYYEISAEYGNLENLRTLVREAHARNMAVILDWVANHTAWDNPWIQDPSWYTQDAGGNIISPAGTNWMDVADLNFDNNDMRLEMIRALKYWVLVANVDGYRFDAADYVPFSFWQQAIDSLNTIPNRELILLAEGARADHFTAGFQMNFSWSYYDKVKNVFQNNHWASGLYQTHLNDYAPVPAGKHKLRFTSNHDKCAWDNTPLALFGGKRGSMNAFVVSTFIGGVPLIYTGQEVGCPVKLPYFSNYPVNWTTNSDMLIEYKWLLALRAAHPALRTGSLDFYNDVDVTAFKRQQLTDEVLVIANMRNTTVNYNIPAAIQNSTWNDALTGAATSIGTALTLSAYEYRVFIK